MRLFSFVGHAVNLSLFYWLLKSVSSSARLGCLGVLLFLVFIQNSWDHNLLTSYMPHLYVFSLLLSSLILFLRYLETQTAKYLLWSASLYFFSLAYETNVVYLPVFFFFAFASARLTENNPLRALRRAAFYCRYLLGSALLYLFVYFVLRYCGAVLPLTGSSENVVSGYSITAGFENIRRMLDVIVCHGLSSFPTFVYGYYRTFVNEGARYSHGQSLSPLLWLNEVKVAWVAKSVIAAFLTQYLLRSLTRKDLQQIALFPALMVGCYLTFAPGIPVSLVQKYQDWVQLGVLGYINTYFSLYGAVFLALVFLIYSMVSLTAMMPGGRLRLLRAAAILAISCGIAAISLVVDYSNNSFTMRQLQSGHKWKSVDLFLQSKDFKEIPASSVIYAPGLFCAIGPMTVFPPYWTDYFAYKTGGTYNILDEKALIPAYIKNQRVIFDKPGSKNIKVVGTFAELKQIVDLRKPQNLYYLKFSQEIKDPSKTILLQRVAVVGKNWTRI